MNVLYEYQRKLYFGCIFIEYVKNRAFQNFYYRYKRIIVYIYIYYVLYNIFTKKLLYDHK